MKTLLLYSLLLLSGLVGCGRNSPEGTDTTEPSAAAPPPPQINVSAELSEQAQNTADRFYEWLSGENYGALQAMLDAESIPDAAWTEALMNDLREKQTKLGLPKSRQLRRLENLPDANRKIYAATYWVSYTKGFEIEETLFLIPAKESNRLNVLDYSFDSGSM